MIGQRLKIERERLGKTQPEFGAIAGVGKTTVINWEKDASSPTAAQLSALAAAEVDVFYVLTGQRITSTTPEPLTQEEIALVKEYRQSAPEVQAAAHRMMKPTESDYAKRIKVRSGARQESKLKTKDRIEVRSSERPVKKFKPPKIKGGEE